MQSIAIRSAPESCLIALEWASSALPDNWTHLHSWHRCIHPFIYSFIVFPIVFVHSHSFATAMLSGLVGWLELIFVRRIGIKSTILPPEGHVGRAELWIYSAAALP
jgi:hypothetical protein